MKAKRPLIVDARYGNLKGNDKVREYERDVTIYKQAELLEQLTKQNQENQLNIKEQNELKKEQIEVLNKQNKLLEEQNFLKYATEEQIQKYRKQKEEEHKLELEVARYQIKQNTIRQAARELSNTYSEYEETLRQCIDNQINRIESNSKLTGSIKALLVAFIFMGGLIYSISIDNKILAGICILVSLIMVMLDGHTPSLSKSKIRRLNEIYLEIPEPPVSNKSKSLNEYKSNFSSYLLSLIDIYNKYKSSVFKQVDRNFVNEVRQTIKEIGV